jgi:mannose-1-phosphate guanylyltransferase
MTPFVAIIMAGGKGQRFWPLSTEAKPKQFLDLERCGRTLIQSTFDRLLPLTGSPSNILVATAERYVKLVKNQLPEIPEDNLLIEPVGRDSAPAVALASLTVHERYGRVVTGFFSSDHRIGDNHAFQETVRQAIALADSSQGLVTIGITPTRPATGYGYIQAGQPAGAGFAVQQFVEKPNLPRAESYLAAGNYYWNAGIFVWHSGVILSELDTHSPDLMRPLRQACCDGAVASVFPTLNKISIDYAVMEKTDKAFVVPGNFDWDDIGDWVALERLLNHSEAGANTVVGTHVGLEASGNIVYTENPDDVVVTLGVENLVIVKRGNTIFLANKNSIQDIKKLLEDERLSHLVMDQVM